MSWDTPENRERYMEVFGLEDESKIDMDNYFHWSNQGDILMRRRMKNEFKLRI